MRAWRVVYITGKQERKNTRYYGKDILDIAVKMSRRAKWRDRDVVSVTREPEYDQ